jgi:hypothetical protein
MRSVARLRFDCLLSTTSAPLCEHGIENLHHNTLLRYGELRNPLDLLLCRVRAPIALKNVFSSWVMEASSMVKS